MQTIALFPLSTVLLPQGRLRLKIFEPRYLDLVSRCLKSEGEEGFGVVWLREGSEVHEHNSEIDTRLAHVGTYARIVDWEGLPGGQLGITIAGDKKFRLISSHQRPDHLHMAEVDWLTEELDGPLDERAQPFQQLLEQLLAHPHIDRLQLQPQLASLADLGFLLTQLLPLPESMKFQLLAESSAEQRLAILSNYLEEMSQ